MVTQNMFSTQKHRFVTALAIFKRLKQIRYQKLLLTCAPISKLPSHISTMLYVI